MRHTLIILAAGLWLTAATAADRIRYEGSSTVGKIISHSQFVYRDSKFNVSTLTESAGGEQCVLNKTCDIGGVAREVKPQVTALGAVKTLLGRDALAVIVSTDNPVDNLTLEQVRDIFTGQISNWNAVGGPDQPIKAYIVKPNSATYGVFRKAVLGDEDYNGVDVIPFDAKMVSQVGNEVGAIGQISTAFLRGLKSVKAVTIDGQAPSSASDAYPITRPLYLVTPGEPAGAVKSYIEWLQGPKGQEIINRLFPGAS